MFCRKCGTQLDEASAFCSRCGAAVGPFVAKAREDVSPKSRLATSLLAWFLGHFGVHRFYVGKIGTALVMLVLGIVSGVCWFGGFLGTLAAGGDHPIWGLLVIAVTGNFKDSQSRIIKRW
jgi:TM2 domain-containing membrane protein YozV